MISLNKQLAEKTSWKSLASAGLFLLFALLISLAGVGETLAHSTILVDRNQSEHSRFVSHSTIVVIDSCHHRQRADRAKHFQGSKAHQDHGNASHGEGSDCNTCCPYELNTGSSAYLRSKHDRDWFAVLDDSEKVTKPFYASIGPISLHANDRSQHDTSQLSGLSGAQTQFLNTIRLLT